jgi:hypothetical protein
VGKVRPINYFYQYHQLNFFRFNHNDEIAQSYHDEVSSKATKNHGGLGFGTYSGGTLKIAGIATAKATTPLKST